MCMDQKSILIIAFKLTHTSSNLLLIKRPSMVLQTFRLRHNYTYKTYHHLLNYCNSRELVIWINLNYKFKVETTCSMLNLKLNLVKATWIHHNPYNTTRELWVFRHTQCNNNYNHQFKEVLICIVTYLSHNRKLLI